jgi:asparagine synthase (glutamine-hydrolysing)
MFFSAFIGRGTGLTLWREAVGLHGRWLGETLRVESLKLSDAGDLFFGWLDCKFARESLRLKHAEGLTATESLSAAKNKLLALTEKPLAGTAAGGSSNAVAIEASLRTGEITVNVPPATPQQFYFARVPHGHVFGDDLRLFRHLLENRLDERAVYALFQYGAIPPPLTAFKGVRRIPNGHTFRFDPGWADPVCIPAFHLGDLKRQGGARANPETTIQEELDGLLAGVPRSSVLYFSGGVDSGLLASRFARLGRTDVQLVNYAFHDGDEESRLALRMAARLGLRCHRVGHDPARVADVLRRLGEDYAHPFGDCSTVPTNILAHESLKWVGRSHTVIEGTGADGAFGVGEKYRSWARVYAVPALLRRQGSAAYERLKLWRYDGGLERLGRVARKSLSLTPGEAVVAENALDGVAYTIPDEVRSGLREAVETNFEVMSAGAPPEERLSLLDLAWVCAGRMAPKSFEPLRRHGIQAVYPFLEPTLLRAALSLSWGERSRPGEAKALLKTLLARTLPREWVYRPKSGFAPSHRELLGSAAVQEFLRDVVLSVRNPWLDFCRRDNVSEMVERARRRRTLSPGACDFLWTLTFASGWFNQLPTAALERRATGLLERQHKDSPHVLV